MKNIEEELFKIEKLTNNIFINKGNSTDVIIFIHGTLTSELSLKNKINKLRSVYNGDIIYTMIEGYGCNVEKITNVTESIQETYNCIDYVKKLNKYKTINLYGHSLGGFMAIATAVKYNIYYINNIYLQSTLASLFECKLPILTELLILFLKEDELDLYTLLHSIKCKKLFILHSKDDNLISFDHAMKNSKIKNDYIETIKLIEISGKHMGKFEPGFKLPT